MLATTTGWELEVERGPGWLFVRICNPEIFGDESPSLAESLWSLLEQQFTYRLVLELDRIKLLNSYLIGQLIEVYRRIREHDGVLRLCGLSIYNRRVLRTCRLEDRLPVYQDRRDAVLGATHPRQPR
jgi:anti-anti-sigma factor